MALTKYYVIQDAYTSLYYTSDHTTPVDNRWSYRISDGYEFATYADAEYEIDTDSTLPNNEFVIVEVIVKA